MRAALTFPPAPYLSHAAGEEGGYATTPSPQPPSSPPREAEEEVRVAVAILRLHLATMPRPSDHPSPAAREWGWGCGRPAALSFTALVGTGSKSVPPSVFLRQTWRPPQGPQHGSGAGGAGDCATIASQWLPPDGRHPPPHQSPVVDYHRLKSQLLVMFRRSVAVNEWLPDQVRSD